MEKRGINYFTTKRGNTIWMGTMDLAWQQVASFCGDKHLQFHTSHPQALITIDNFNQNRFSKEQISPDSIYVKAGRGPATQDHINLQVKKKFPDFSFPPLAHQMGEKDVISFAYLFKQLKFPTAFKRREQRNFTFNGKKVDSFYAEDQYQRNQVRMHFYKDRQNFMISIWDGKQKDAMYLFKTQENKTMGEVIRDVKSFDVNGGFLMDEDKFQMPVIDFDCERQYNEIVGLCFKNKKLEGSTVAVMKEALKLKVDEEGAKMESMADMYVNQCSIQIKMDRQFILDKTFWLVMKEVGKYPYLCVKVIDPTETK